MSTHNCQSDSTDMDITDGHTTASQTVQTWASHMSTHNCQTQYKHGHHICPHIIVRQTVQTWASLMSTHNCQTDSTDMGITYVLVFIVIGRSCSEICGFDSPCRPDSFLRFNSRPIMYGAVGSLVSNGVLGPSTWIKFPLEPFDLIV